MKKIRLIISIILFSLFSDSFANQNIDSLKVSPKKHYVGIGIPRVALLPIYITKGIQKNGVIDYSHLIMPFYNIFQVKYGIFLSNKFKLENITSFDTYYTSLSPSFIGVYNNLYVLKLINKKKINKMYLGSGISFIAGNIKTTKNSYNLIQIYPSLNYNYTLFAFKNSFVTLYGNVLFLIPKTYRHRGYREEEYQASVNRAIRPGYNFFNYRFFSANFFGISYEISF